MRSGSSETTGKLFCFVGKLGKSMVLAEKLGVGIDPLTQWLELLLSGVMPLTRFYHVIVVRLSASEAIFAADLLGKGSLHVLDIIKDDGMSMNSMKLAEHI